MTIAEKSVVADALKRVRKNMQQEATQEFIRRYGHQLLPLLVLIVLVGEGYLTVFKFLQPVVGDCHPVGITTQVIEDSIRATEWRLGIDHPVTVLQGCHIAGKALRI